MNISGWHINGFGVFADFAVDDIAPGLTVFEGHNGAGKSTLFTFVQTMLFGPSTSRNDPNKYHPLNGGQHGGVLHLTSTSGQDYTIYRQLAKRDAISIRANDAAVEPSVLNQLLGHCDQQTFKAVFAVNLSDLQSLDAMDHEETKQRLALAGLSGSGTSPQDVLKRLDTRTGTLLKRSGTKAEINAIADKINHLNARLKEARTASAQYAEVRQRESLATNERERIEEEATALRRQQDRYQRLINIWETWLAFNQAKDDRDALALHDALDNASKEIDALHASIDRYDEWQGERDSWQVKLRSAEADVAEHLRNLGPEWNEHRLVGFDRSIPRREDIRSFESRLERSEEALRQANADVERRREPVAETTRAREAAQAALADLGEPETQEGLDHQRSSLTHLRATLSEASTLEMTIRADEQHLTVLRQHQASEASRAAGSPPVWLAPAAGIAALVLLAIGVWLLVSGALVSAGLVLAAAIILLALGVWVRGRNAPEASTGAPSYIEQELDQLTASLERDYSRLAELTDALASYAEVVGVTPRPSSIEVEEAASKLDHRGQHRHVFLAKQAALAEAERLDRQASAARAQAENAREQAIETNAAEKTAWRKWQETAGIPVNLSPETSIDFLQESEEARERYQAATEARQEVNRLSTNLDALEGRLRAVLDKLGEPVPEPGYATVLAIKQLMARVNEERATRQMYAEHDVKAKTAQQSVTATLGTGDEAATSQALLRTGSLPDWQDVGHQATARLDTLEAEKTRTIEDGRTAQLDRERLEASGDIASLELELNGLKAEATEAIREWAVLSLASGLIKRTLAKFELERQPAVMQQASSLFTEVTQGAYQRVSSSLATSGKDDTEILISRGSGEPVTATQLSQGTMEQLYLCLRLGLANALSDKTGALPLLMDDVLVNFDPVRVQQVAKVLCKVAEDRQVLLFTCHPRTVNLLHEITGGCAHYKMGRDGEAGEWHHSA